MRSPTFRPRGPIGRVQRDGSVQADEMFLRYLDDRVRRGDGTFGDLAAAWLAITFAPVPVPSQRNPFPVTSTASAVSTAGTDWSPVLTVDPAWSAV